MDERNHKPADPAPLALDDERRVKVLSPGMLVFKRFVRNKLAIAGSIIILFMFLFSFLGGVLMPYSESQVFKEYAPLIKDYAAVTENEEYRYVIAEGKSFDATAKSKMIWAINNGESSFPSGETIYGLTQEGADFYRITSTQVVASGRGIRNHYELDPAPGFFPPEDFMEAFYTAVANKAARFTTEDGQSYLLTTTKVEAVVSAETNLALASKMIFSGELSETFAFRLEAERAIQGEAPFIINGVPYTFHVSERGVVSFQNAEGVEIATASRFAVKAAAVGTVFPPGFMEAVQDSIAEGSPYPSFTLPDADGTEREYLVTRNAKEYIIRTEQIAYQITMYEAPSWAHWLGTDGNGMDVMTRLMFGGRVSLLIGFIVVLLETFVGVILGGVSGYFGRWIDNLIMRIVDVFNCIPALPLYIIAGSIMDAMKVDPAQRIFYLMILMGALGWPSIARIVRGQILSLREQEFMIAAEATGISTSRRIFRHLVPNVVPQLIVVNTMNLGIVILVEATLSFLGLGVKYPLASWGNIIYAVTNIHVLTNYLFVWIPAGMLILLTVLGFNFVGDGLRDAFDPKMKR